MDTDGSRTRMWLTFAVLAHLAVSLVHGTAHVQARVPLSRADNIFVFLVVIVGPMAGLALIRSVERTGAWLIASTMAASLVFGFVNHFVIAGADHVAQVDPRARSLFAATAVLLAASEAIAAALAIRLGGERKPS